MGELSEADVVLMIILDVLGDLLAVISFTWGAFEAFQFRHIFHTVA
jgi:hypothetical protein